MKINSVSTDSCEDGGGEEDRLEVVPVDLVVLTDDVQASRGCPVCRSLVVPQQHLNILTLQILLDRSTLTFSTKKIQKSKVRQPSLAYDLLI